MTGRARIMHIPTVVWILLFPAGLSVWLLSFVWTEHGSAWRALLISFIYFTSLSGGLVVWPAIIKTAGGKWADGFEERITRSILFSVPSIITLLVLWAASSTWAPWYAKKTPQGFWLNNTFLFSRQLIALLIFWGIAVLFLKRGRHNGRGFAAFFILIFCLTFTLVGFDLVMALDYHWHSALFGGYFFVSSLYIAMAAWGLIAALQKESTSEFRRDIGTLLLAFSVLTTYMMFAQLLPIWYENLPRETRFLYDRLHYSPARQISYILLATVYLGPLVLLLTTRAKTGRVWLGLISGFILVMMWLERWWLVAPTFSRHPLPGAADIGIALAFLSMCVLGFGIYRRRGEAESGVKR